MPKVLTSAAVEQYHREGFYFPIRVLSTAEAASYRRRLEDHERKTGAPLQGNWRHKCHLLFTWADELVHHPKILDAVEDVIGPNILCWTTNFFIKEANNPGFVSWHQDATYWGLEPDDVVTAWVAFTEVTPANGYMQVIPGSHKIDQLPHVDTFHKDNLLSRGQEIAVEVDESKAVDIALQPGEMSLHHIKLVHGSEPEPHRRPAHRARDPLHPDLRAPDQGARLGDAGARRGQGREFRSRAAPAARPRRRGARRARRVGRAAGQGALLGHRPPAVPRLSREPRMAEERKKLTIPDLLEAKRTGRRLVMASIPDYPTAIWAERAGLDIVAIGDSLAMVSYGHPNTLPVTVDLMIEHCAGGAARRAQQLDRSSRCRTAATRPRDRGAERAALHEGGRRRLREDAGRPRAGADHPRDRRCGRPGDESRRHVPALRAQVRRLQAAGPHGRRGAADHRRRARDRGGGRDRLRDRGGAGAGRPRRRRGGGHLHLQHRRRPVGLRRSCCSRSTCSACSTSSSRSSPSATRTPLRDRGRGAQELRGGSARRRVPRRRAQLRHAARRGAKLEAALAQRSPRH